MTVEERDKYLDEKQQERDTVNKKIGELSAQRADWLATEGKKIQTEAGTSFDKSVSEMIQRQMNK